MYMYVHIYMHDLVNNAYNAHAQSNYKYMYT